MSKARLRCIHFLVIWEQTEFHDNLLQELIIFILSDNRQEFLPGKVRNPFFPPHCHRALHRMQLQFSALHFVSRWLCDEGFVSEQSMSEQRDSTARSNFYDIDASRVPHKTSYRGDFCAARRRRLFSGPRLRVNGQRRRHPPLPSTIGFAATAKRHRHNLWRRGREGSGPLKARGPPRARSRLKARRGAR